MYCLLFYSLLFISAIKTSPLFNLKYIGYILVINHLTFKGLCSHSNKVFFLLLAEGQLFSICRPSLVSFTNKTCHCHANTLRHENTQETGIYYEKKVLTVIVNNSTNKCFNQLHLTLNHGTQKGHESHGEGNSGPGLIGNTS
jgi:hypothetical protein